MSVCIYFHAGCMKPYGFEVTKQYAKWQFFPAMPKCSCWMVNSELNTAQASPDEPLSWESTGREKGGRSAAASDCVLLLFLTSCHNFSFYHLPCKLFSYIFNSNIFFTVFNNLFPGWWCFRGPTRSPLQFIIQKMDTSVLTFKKLEPTI